MQPISAELRYEPRVSGDTLRRAPVLNVLDANGAFPIAVEMARFLKFDPAMKEEPIIMGIGYPVGRYWNTIPHRTRDFTPTAHPETVARWGLKLEFSPDGSGGAAKFLEALPGEIIPLVEGRYRIDERRRALYGCSKSGLFAYYALWPSRTNRLPAVPRAASSEFWSQELRNGSPFGPAL